MKLVPVSCLIVMPATTIVALTTTLRRHSMFCPILQRRIPSCHHRRRLVQFSTLSDSEIEVQPIEGSNAQRSKSPSAFDQKNKSHTRNPHPPPPDPTTFPPSSYDARSFFRFEILHESSKSMARVGRIHTPHGVIDTPGYVAVATNAALKGVDFRDVDTMAADGQQLHEGQQLVFCNTYHLLLQPGTEVVEGAGGLHTFMNRRDRPLITDSGGFQVFSLAYGSVHEELSTGGELKRASNKGRNRKTSHANGGDPSTSSAPPVRVTEEGAVFRSYRDGRKFLLTPESTVRAQKSFGADIIIPLDELPPYHIDPRVLADSVERTHRWEARSLKEHLRDVREQAMYCVVHGGLDRTLRKKSLDYLTSLPFDGYAIGGSLGKDGDELLELLEWMMPLLNENAGGSSVDRRSKPRHLLGIADEPSILGAVRNGIDTMDSCYPTRLARHGTLLTREGKIHIKSGRYSRQYGVPIDPECDCPTCRRYDRPYLWHLFKAKEPVFMTLATIHNIHYMNDLMARQRQLIFEDKI
eukprot:CAMPEP_0172532368 /NCGR_PEP_ID=MMETSP1067-20121228/5450_1 /TAXON_ID=265564 ORGANISM="Thalassiosira punctigera, Strain Tpunct2005C2" /NCGR_SAMPLE_ID=MMETSP1067 /ASSEMBLY_ACC=CAM_ASM_000444 /LENGTH=523 /DNA_ID=CAMNT_0013316875 /DNA_START=145 /DNA_END=1716 /DNA_ORIENTATION=-